jgi:hypothetical protein
VEPGWFRLDPSIDQSICIAKRSAVVCVIRPGLAVAAANDRSIITAWRQPMSLGPPEDEFHKPLTEHYPPHGSPAAWVALNKHRDTMRLPAPK